MVRHCSAEPVSVVAAGDTPVRGGDTAVDAAAATSKAPTVRRLPPGSTASYTFVNPDVATGRSTAATVRRLAPEAIAERKVGTHICYPPRRRHTCVPLVH
jgi:hypothetical protein